MSETASGTEAKQAKYYVAKHVAYGLLIIFVVLPIITSLFTYFKYGFSDATTTAIAGFWKQILNPLAYFDFYGNWIDNETGDANDWRFMGWPVELVAAIMLGIGYFIFRAGSNPYSFKNTSFGAARLANTADILKMKLLEASEGVKDRLIILGEWQKKMMMLPETLSILCVAPPGTGKTTSIVIPTILTCDKVSMLVNDVKPELFDLSSGYRSQFSHCYRLEWAATDDPENGIFYPRWNPLSPKSMPPAGPNRDLYIERLVNIIVEEPSGNADPHWSKKGRATLAGFIQYLVGKCEQGRYDGIPEEWQYKEPSIPMLLDWMTAALRMAEKKLEEEVAAKGRMAAMGADPMKDFLRAAANEAEQYGYSQRAVMEITSIANTPDKERGSILSTMDSGLIIFRNSAVKARTMNSDFAFKDFRGIQDPVTGKWTPITVYICVNQEDARALGVITGLLVESLSAFMVAHAPNSKTRTGEQCGPCDMMFVLDEFPQMPKLQALIDGPAVGRGQRVSYLMIGQDLGQIETKYSKEEVEVVISTTAAKVVLPLNNEVTAKRFSEMVGQHTLETKSKSRTHGMSKQTNPFAHNIQRSLQGQPLIRPEDFMSIPAGKHYVLMQGYNNRPILCDTPAYYSHRTFKNQVYAPNYGMGLEYPPAATMPQFAWDLRQEEYEQEQMDKELKEAIARNIRLQEEEASRAKEQAARGVQKSGDEQPSIATAAE